MKKTLTILSLIIILTSLVSVSCGRSTSIDDSIVQVFEPANATGENTTLLSFGVAVGDGSQILTVLNYEDYTPDGLVVGLPGKTKYQALIQAIDPRTSATLLKVVGTKFKPAVIGETDKLKQGDEIIIHGWYDPDFNSLLTSVTMPFSGYNTMMIIDIMNNKYIAYDGAPVTDKAGKLIGLIGTFYNAFVYRLGPPGMTAPMINNKSALELLSPDAVSQPWARGPAFAIITTKESLTGRTFSEPPLANYNAMTAAIESLLGTMGEPLPPDELPSDYRSFAYGEQESIDGYLLSVVYPHLVELRNNDGKIAAEAKWVGIQWGRSGGKPNRLFYGYMQNGNAIPAGGFLITGDVITLEKTLQ
jgi:hypothetical protein